MYLKTLTVRGFKSFASSTTLRFEPGITCVVGPNGSGKSNVVDALAWVMGEQGAKSLRGGKMEDVIFAGTASRPPLGRAEVVLTIDNSDGALPIDYSEVTISRLMFRSGQSEYAINGDSCRLLDVQDLLSDSGIGREMHVIIGQGQLDAVLHSGPEGRRAVIEEAAGVLKHRKRKEKALRKLDAMQANLTRVEDLTTELRRQLKPLGKQAEIARKAATIQSELRDARIRLLADDLVTLKTTLDRDAADEATVRARRAEVEGELGIAQTREAELEAEAQAQAPRLASAHDTLFSLSSLRERLRGIAELAAERHRNAGEAREDERRGRDPEDMEREAAVVREQEETLRERLAVTQEELDEAITERAATEAALKSEERRLADAARASADRREGLAKLRGHVEALRSKIQATEAEIGRLTEALAQAEERAVAAQAERDGHGTEVAEDLELAAEHERAQLALDRAKAAAEEARTSVDGPKQAVRQAGQAVAAARTADQGAQREIAALQARIEALELGLRRSADGAETLLGADLDGVLGTIAELVSVEPGAEVAIAAALGAAAGAVAVSSLETAAEAFGLLRAKDAGRAGLVVGGAPALARARATTADAAEPHPAGGGCDRLDSRSVTVGSESEIDGSGVGAAGPARDGRPSGSVPGARSESDVAGSASGVVGRESSAAGLGGGTGGVDSRSVAAGSGSVPGARSASGVTGSESGAVGSGGGTGLATSMTGADAAEPAPAVRWAVELVKVPESLVTAVGFLLEGVMVVRDLDEGREIIAARPGARVVTWDGDLLGVHWAEGGGAAGGQSLLEMRGTLDEAVRRLAEVRAEAGKAADSLAAAVDAEAAAQGAVEAAQAAANDAQRGVGEAQSVLDRVRSRVREADAVAAAQANRLAQFDAAARAMREESTRLAAAVAAAERVRVEDLEGLAELQERVRQAEDAPLDDDEADTTRRDEVAERCQELRSLEMEARLSVRTAEERVKAISGRADALERAAVTERTERARAAERRERRAREAKVAYAVMIGAQRAVLAIERSLAAALTEREAAERDRAAREEGLKAVRVRVRELSGELEKLVNAVHGTEVARAEQRLRMEQLEERALEEFGLEIAGLIAEYGPDQLIPLGPDAAVDAVPEAYVREVQEKRARHAEKQLQTLGRVNPLALEEFAALEERHAFLTSQLEDLKKTRRDLLTVVKEVDERVEQVFASAYEDTAREFEHIFGRLFPGGEGRLMLTEPEDMLTTGVEVEARPPGKKVKRLSLLSGGERSLVAIALLVAIFKARPSPFYVLDEVEAALDDTNTQRLLSILEELRESSQLIIITHQKRTMEGADALYGVSMQGDGVTQVISQRLREPEPA